MLKTCVVGNLGMQAYNLPNSWQQEKISPK